MSSNSNNNQQMAPAYEIILQIRQVDRKFRRARNQIIILNNSLESLIARYKRSTRQGNKACRYATRLQVATVEGVRNMFYEYARRQCEDMDNLQDRLKELTGSEYDNFEEFQ